MLVKQTIQGFSKIAGDWDALVFTGGHGASEFAGDDGIGSRPLARKA